MNNAMHTTPQSKSPPVDRPEGFAKVGQIELQQANDSESLAAPQEVSRGNKQAEDTDPVTRLEAAFKRVGATLYALCDGSFLAVQIQGGASQACPDRRAACALLRALGG